MVGKPNLPETGDRRPHPQGAARATPGLAALDQQREASMADEGGASGAVMESEDESAVPQILTGPSTAHRRRAAAFIAGAAVGVVASAWALRRYTE